MKTVVLGITSGIAAYKSIQLIQLLKREKLDVIVIMTKHATQMVAPKEFEQVSGNNVYTELFEKDFNYKYILKKRKVDHIEIADTADAVVIAPATANCIAKITHGIADDFLTTMLLATQAPIILCPSMNVHMWQNPVVQDNISQLKRRDFHVIEPESGMLACGYEGAGRLAHIETIKNEILYRLQVSSSLAGKKIMITTGGTMEKIDEVRFIANKSSGKMGAAIADECFVRGANVLLLRSKTAVAPRYRMEEKAFETADELFELIKQHIADYDILFHVAAVSDFEVKSPYKGKLPSNKDVTLQLMPRKKILDSIKKLNPKIKLIAFKAEYGLSESDLIKKASNRLRQSHADAIVANDVGKIDRGFQADTNEIFIVLKNGSRKKIPLNSKCAIASGVVNFITEELHL